MLMLFGDQLRDARASGRPGGVTMTWFRCLGDLIATSLSERLAPMRGPRSLGPAPSRLTRALGVSGIVGGTVLVASFVPILWPDGDVFNARLIVLNVGSISIAAALARRYMAGRSKFVMATAGAVVLVNLGHLVLIAGIVAQPGEPGAGSFPPPYGATLQAVWAIGVAFGIVSLARGVGSRPGSVALAVGSGLAFSPTVGLVGELIGTASLVGIALVGIGWVLLGVDVATRRGTGSTAGGDSPKA
jgi:hypothetical protein